MDDYSIEQRLFYLKKMLNEESCLENYKNSVPFMFSKKLPFSVSWDEIFSLVDQDINNNISTNQEYYKGTGFKIKKADRLYKVGLVVDHIEELFQRSKNGAKTRPSDWHHVYVNFTTSPVTNDNIHSDNDNIFFWQVQGRSLWKMYKYSTKTTDQLTEEDVEFTFTLNDGDLIYCPKNTRHSVTTISPRAGMSLGFNNLK